jgi:hypothetical protein
MSEDPMLFFTDDDGKSYEYIGMVLTIGPKTHEHSPYEGIVTTTSSDYDDLYAITGILWDGPNDQNFKLVCPD